MKKLVPIGAWRVEAAAEAHDGGKKNFPDNFVEMNLIFYCPSVFVCVAHLSLEMTALFIYLF